MRIDYHGCPTIPKNSKNCRLFWNRSCRRRPKVDVLSTFWYHPLYHCMVLGTRPKWTFSHTWRRPVSSNSLKQFHHGLTYPAYLPLNGVTGMSHNHSAQRSSSVTSFSMFEYVVVRLLTTRKCVIAAARLLCARIVD